MSNEYIPPGSSPKMVILGFSKGGTVVNQLVTEMASLATQCTSKSVPISKPYSGENLLFPTSSGEFLNNSILRNSLY
jgi:hypothetical protein